MEPKTGRRIVSKGAYVTSVGNILFNFLVGWTLICLAFIGFVTAFALFLYRIVNAATYATAIVALCVSASLMGYIGCKNIKRSFKIDLGLPFTRANTAELPAPESLVRASSEPLQAQEDVLLRAAAQGVDTPPEQLVRASMGQGQAEGE